MPGGNTHDAITFILTVPAAAAGFYFTGSFAAAAIVAIAFLFGGLMFGPDLDTISRQYSRWRFFRFLWFPYRSFFKHRSRWTHGLIFSTLFRVVYFMGIVSAVLIAASYLSAIIFATPAPHMADLVGAWSGLGRLSTLYGAGDMLLLIFIGMWSGAASHTFADMAGTYIKTGRTKGFL